jgi:hypothetical protein
MIDRTFTSAQPNLRVNGQNFESATTTADASEEPFDEALDRRIWSLADNRLAWHKVISDTRRKVPKEMEGRVGEVLEEYKSLDRVEVESMGIRDDGTVETERDEAFEERYPHIEEGFRRTTALGEELNQVRTSTLVSY